MQTLDHEHVTIHVDAPPEVVYALVADVTRTPELSPEVVRCSWLDGATGPAVGARFEATNKVARGRAWKNRPVVIAAQPGREFAFRVPKRFAGTLVWRYLFQPDGDGALVTESYEVTRPVSRLGWFIIGRLYGRHDRRADLRAGMEHTLHRIRESAESGAHLVANGDVRRGEHVAVPRVDFAGVLDVHVVAAPGCARRPILVATIAFGFDVATHSHDDTR